ncbi:hypothetical protein LMH87_011095 [Akanthomyces muscarius]|uniref:Uncharacterized protein n=1 Tax=Akanthomyces muscarius TaxID=2231603 RepID=A0A9W8QBS8_AKAMU|nr:hypothetical protein LMH87_011095 [Akanthomyces muscarius]KAJ4150343.1 hypothetical protein LMH87_011095 [Akanthomyces muscarius]
MPDISGYEIFHFVCDALLFVTLVASITFAICAAVRLHRRRDPARRVFSWVKIAWLLFTIAVFTSFIEAATVTVTSRVYQAAYYSVSDVQDDEVDLIARISSGASALAHCFNVFAEVIVYLTLASFIRCIRLAGPHDEKHARRHRWSRYSAYVISFGITILSLAVFSVGLYWVVLSEISSSSNGIAWDRYYNNYIVASAIMSLICQAFLALLAISMLIRSCVLRRKLRASKSLHKPMRYLIACCSLWVVRAAFDIYSIVFQTIAPGYFAPSVDAVTSFNEVLCVIFMTWPVFIILVILYYLGLDMKTGLLSTGSPLLMDDGESQAASSEFLSPEQPIVTPMTERTTAPTLTPVSQRPESLFACDGLADAPPEYSPPAAQHNIASGTAAPPLARVPIIRRPVAPRATESGEQGRQSEEASEVPARQLGTATRQAAAPSPTDNTTQTSPLPLERSSSDEHGTQATSTLSEGESMGLYHQADGRAPESELSSALPSHDEAMGLYHQADGRPPTSEANSSDVLPSHEESMGLFHQADGRPPGVGSGVVPPDNSNAVVYHPSADRPETMTAPPSHDEAMGLYHQADGRVPVSEVLPPEKEKQKN